ncbi:hypothetical protein CR513_57980, partial [Mucuna pruriens]
MDYKIQISFSKTNTWFQLNTASQGTSRWSRYHTPWLLKIHLKPFATAFGQTPGPNLQNSPVMHYSLWMELSWKIIEVYWTPIFCKSYVLSLQYKILIGIFSSHVVVLKPALEI